MRRLIRHASSTIAARVVYPIRASSTIAARVVYPIRPPADKVSGRVIDDQLFGKMYHIPPEVYCGAQSDLHDAEQTHEISVGNGRSLPAPASLEREGFELWSWPTNTVGEMWTWSDDRIRDVYYSEMEAKVKAATGAESVAGFHHLRRDAARDNRDSAKGPGGLSSNAGAAVFRAHSDYTVGNALLLISQLEEGGKLPHGTAASCEAGERSYAIINVWRAAAPVEREPLAVLDASSVDAKQQTFDYAMVTSNGGVKYNSSVSFSERHRWYYYPGQAPHEALVFYGGFEASAPATAPPRFVFHTAIEPLDPPPRADAPPRRSIEARCVVVHPKSGGSLHTGARARGRRGFSTVAAAEHRRPQGVETVVGDLPLYHVSAAGSTGAENAAGGTRGVVVLQEIWGWRGPETGRLRSICDDLAAEGFEVVLPDCHRGDSASGKPDKIGWIRSVSSPVSRVVDDVRAATMWLQRQRGATSVAAVGFCWGAWAFAHASAAGVPLACGVGAHPALKNESNCGFGTEEELAARVTMPVLLLSAGDDPANVQEHGAATAALASRGGRTISFPEMKHGWVTRGDLSVPRVKADTERALAETVAFLRAHT